MTVVVDVADACLLLRPKGKEPYQTNLCSKMEEPLSPNEPDDPGDEDDPGGVILGAKLPVEGGVARRDEKPERE